MKICLVAHEYPPETARGGIGSQSWNKARALSALGHEVHVVSASGVKTTGVRMASHDGVTVHRIASPAHTQPVYEAQTYWMGYSWMVNQYLSTLMETHTFDIIDFAEYAGEGYIYLMDRTVYNWAPVVVQLHGPLSMFSEKIGWPDPASDFYKIGRMMEDFCMHKADALMACSSNIANFTASHHGIERSFIDDVHCGVDAEAFHPAERKPDKRRPNVLFVGNIAANKGVNAVFDAVLLLRSRYPNICLHALGKGDGDAEQQLLDYAKKNHAEKHLNLAGFVGRQELPGWYQQADVFTSPAHHEVGVANVYIEAMGCGCPVIACDTGGAPEAVQDGKSGLLVKPGDVPGLAAAMDKIFSNESMREAMGRAGRERVNDYFAMDKYIQRVLATYARAQVNAKPKLAAKKKELGLSE